jgi:hypothetical protein
VNRAFTSSIIAAAFALSACASRQYLTTPAQPPSPPENTSVGHWEHRHPNNKNLVGVWIQQFPDNPFDAPRYEGKHPCIVSYIFADGRAHSFDYLPDGSIVSQVWSRPPIWMLEHLDIVYRPETLKTLIQRAKANDRNA